MTELSVADYALLLRAGIEPAGIVAWSSVFFASYAYRGMLGAGPGAMGSMQPYELSEFTQALYSARERTMGQITQPGRRARRLRRRRRADRPHDPAAHARRGMGGPSAGSALASCAG